MRNPPVLGLLFAAFSTCYAAEPAPPLVSVCEVMRSPQTYDGRAIVLTGRVSKRDSNRFVSQEGCGTPQAAQLPVRFDRASGPLPPDSFGLDKALVARKFGEISQSTTLQEFKFGSGSYDRWGMVFGRFDRQQGAIVCRGDALIFFWEP